MIASVDMKDLFGTYYPWPGAAVRTTDGRVLLALTDERSDKSCDEVIVYEITGF